jgi:nitrite reductase/ring-hydroxylating ferredoxin subunit
MLGRDENNLVTQVGPGTPLGEMLRRYWLPVCTSAQIAEKDSAPLQVRLLGENFVAFRDTNGKVGVLDEMCMHRGASLALGRVEDCGIRCLYHGWKFGVDGTIQETPNHADPRFRTRLKAPAYPVREEGGLIWTYLGPKDKEPPFQRHRFMDAAPENRCVIRINVNANYLQLWEGGADSSHVGILHSDVARPGWLDKTFVPTTDPLNPGAFVSDDNAPRLEIEDTEFGWHYAAWRKMPPKDGVEVENCRIVPLIMPWTRIIPSPNSYYTVFEVADDDENTSTYIVVDSAMTVNEEHIRKILGLDDPRFYDPVSCNFTALPRQRWGQDRKAMAGNWTGLRGIETEDAVMSLSMGPIMDRTKEHLVLADQGVMRLRRRILQSIRQVQAGGEPIGVMIPDISKIVAGDYVLPVGTRWQDIAAENTALKPQARVKEPA